MRVGDYVEINYKGFQIALVRDIILLPKDCIYVLLFPDMTQELHTHDSLLNIMAIPLDKS